MTPKVGLDKEYLKEKISSQFKDYNFVINKIKGYLKPYFSIHDIIIPKNEIDEILKWW